MTETTACEIEVVLPLWQWIVRIVVVAVELILVYWCAVEGEPFFYQGF